MRRGDHFIFEYPSNAPSGNASCIHKPIAQSSESEVAEFLAQSMATVKSATAEKEMAMAAEKVASVKSDVGIVAVEKATVETSKMIIVQHAELNVSSKRSEWLGLSIGTERCQQAAKSLNFLLVVGVWKNFWLSERISV